MPYEHFITEQEPKETRYCATCHQELHAPFMICAATDRSYFEPPDEEWTCFDCSKDDEAWHKRDKDDSDYYSWQDDPGLW